jgi:hypothetical protein
MLGAPELGNPDIKQKESNMKKIIPLSVVGGALAVVVWASGVQAAPGVAAPDSVRLGASVPGAVEQVHWRRWHWHRNCWWDHGVKYCRRWY